jgi:hypothetical protein
MTQKLENFGQRTFITFAPFQGRIHAPDNHGHGLGRNEGMQT